MMFPKESLKIMPAVSLTARRADPLIALLVFGNVKRWQCVVEQKS